MYNILIVEDDTFQRKNLRIMLEEIGEYYNILEAGNVSDGISLANRNDISLFYLDIDLRGDSGLELAKKIRAIEKYKLTWIVFLTSYVNYIIEAFKEVHCYDYIVKPIEKDEIQSLTKILIQNNKPKYIESTEKDHFFININGILIKIYIAEVLFIETFRKTTKIHTFQGEYEVKNLSLISLLNSISSKNITQSHKSYAINIEHIQSINKNPSCWEICFKDYNKVALLGDKFRGSIVNSCNII